MKRTVLAAGVAFLLSACGSAGAAIAPPSPAGAGAALASIPVSYVSGRIAGAETWSGTVFVTGPATIDPGATVTVGPGTAIVVTASPTLAITVKGLLDIQGSSAADVVVRPSVAGGHWNRFVIPSGGQVMARHLVESGGGFQLVGGKLTLIDSAMSRASGDLIEGSGTFDVEYSSIGLAPGQSDGTHCDMHFNPGHNVIKISHTNVSTAVYGVMFYGGSGADFTYDNWFANQIDVEILSQYPVSGDFSHDWFARPASVPAGPGVTAQSLSPTRLPVGTAGPRP